MVIKNDNATVEQAIAKLNDKAQKETAKDRKATAIYSAVKAALEDFCRQDVTFADAILKSTGTLGACCEKAVEGSGNSISDIEVYRKAAKFYFPKAEVEFQMKLILDVKEVSKEEPKKAVVLNLFDLL